MRAQQNVSVGPNGSGQPKLLGRLRARVYPLGTRAYPKGKGSRAAAGLTERECLSRLGYDARDARARTGSREEG
jgi:hypothetical protein